MKTKKEYVQHFSTRIPWKDNDYTGRVDDNPKYNVAAQVIPNIGNSRDIELEEKNKGKFYQNIGSEKFKNWITENSAFMSKTELEVKMNHPYKNGKNEKFSHYRETSFKLKPYSFLLRPFAWTLKGNAKELAKYYNFNFDYEGNERMLNWNSSWISHGESQRAIFEYFFSGIVPNKSLIFPYYKQVPFIEDNRRVIAGIGNLVNFFELKEYSSDGSREEKNYIWETNTPHSIRNHGEQGFLMPYFEISKYLINNPDFDVSSVTLFEPEGFRNEFSYAAEWVSYDATIDVLNQAKKVLRNIAKLNLETANQDWVNIQLEYVEKQLKAVWNQRGIFPGLASVLFALGIKHSFDLARFINTSENDLISELKQYFSGEKETGNDKLDESIAEKEDEFNGLLKHDNKLKYFELLTRISLSVKQASNVWKKFKDDHASEIINNPYLLYELTRKESQEYQIAISQIDNAMFVNDLVENNYPLTNPTKMRTEADKRRFRAMTMLVLEHATNCGHTLLSYDQIIEKISSLPLDRKTEFQTEKIEGIIEFLVQGGLYVDITNNYIKLKEYQEYKELIFKTLSERINENIGNRQEWLDIINKKFGSLKKGNEEKDRVARNEKAKALKTIESSKVSVFLGRAGTGKTTALGIFASVNEIKEGGLLALTPTGKARIQLENSFKENNVEAECMTIAQFLVRSGGFSWSTMSYKLPNKNSTSVSETVIIDESSMLTENMFAGILKLVSTHAKRIIFTGDKNQLPPIGAGRPFTDMIMYLEKNAPEKIASLMTEMRQDDTGDDLAFAQLFSDINSVDKGVIQRVKSKKTDERLEYIEYTDLEHLENLFFDKVLPSITEMENREDIDGFNKSLGATMNDQYTHYNTSKHIEDWQIISPTRWIGIGTYYLNEQIHIHYRQNIVDKWNYQWSKCNPQSIQKIVYGDKVISNVNEDRECWSREKSQGCKEYIANGEIGIMMNYPKQFGRDDRNDKYYKFMFNSYDSHIFSYTKNDFGSDEGDSKLELAYALTVHKSQGSGFGKTLVVINGKSALLSKELLYTAFSRQKDGLKILSDLPIAELLKYSNDWYSDTKQRYTDLFEKPDIVEIQSTKQKRYFEEKLIHKTVRGEMVRSKSEVIVANIIDKMGIDYTYEELLTIKGKNYLPDFTLRYQGRTAYLEHLGMLGNILYKAHWKEKQSSYEESGISEQIGNLIITQDGLDGSLDSKIIEDSINKWKNNI
ncbi:AAA family ATPase [Chryseobacterium arachidis]|uniref:AAA family ATPase n=1 Tax=Chryseobacterium arachidis TaxID=1416778 RepID=UPI0015B5B50D|nr:AAA family ATPase [Chryseobacterium arachidis]